MKKLLIIFVVFSFYGCAATYKQPEIAAPDTFLNITGSQLSLLQAAKRVLVSQGFQITNSDDAAGVISTTPKDIRLTPDLADCGTTMGIDYLKDNRTSSKVGYGVVATDNRIILKANLSANYLPGEVTQGITLSCVSRGVLERDMLAMIRAAVN